MSLTRDHDSLASRRMSRVRAFISQRYLLDRLFADQ